MCKLSLNIANKRYILSDRGMSNKTQCNFGLFILVWNALGEKSCKNNSEAVQKSQLSTPTP